ncbi:unnamed protein product, partial [Ranitomeya imitator]
RLDRTHCNTMSSCILVFCLISALPCVLSQISVSLLAPSLVKPSHTMKLTCQVTGALITEGNKLHGINFLRQHDGHKLVFLAHINYAQGTAYKPSLSSRISLSRDTSKNEVYLQSWPKFLRMTAKLYFHMICCPLVFISVYLMFISHTEI